MPLASLRQDLRYSLRSMRKNPGFAVTVVLTLGLGIGATTAIFTVVSGVLLRPLPFPEPERLVAIQEDYGPGPNVFIASMELLAWQKQSRTLSQVAAYFNCSVNLVGGQSAERLECGSVTESLFPALGVRPKLGRNFVPAEDRLGGPPAVILSHALWRRRFAGDHSIVGKAVTLDDRSYTIVGVMPEDFQIPGEFREKQDLWLPFQLEEGRAHFKLVWAIGRLRPGVPIATARAELDTLYRATRQGRMAGRIVLTPWQGRITGRVRSTLFVLLAAVGLVLLIACVNVANILLSRATGREREIAVRRALGAAPSRILRQLLTESVLLALCGGLAGLALAVWIKDLLIAFLAQNLPMVPPIPVDLRVMAFNIGLALACGIAFGLAPALQGARIPVNESLKATARSAGEGAGRTRLRDLLVVAEVCLATALLIGAGLLFRSFLLLRGMDSGLRADRILAIDLPLKGARYAAPQNRAAFLQQASESLRGVPGVESVAITFGGDGSASTGIEGRTDAEASAAWDVVSAEYFRTMGIPFLKGRNFSDSDTGSAPEVVIVSQSFARRYFPHDDAIGHRLGSLFRKDEWMTIVGTVGDIRPDLETDPGPAIYTFYLQQGRAGAASGNEVVMRLLARTADQPTRLAATLRSRLAALDRMQVPSRIQTLEQWMAESIAPRRVYMMMLFSFALLALLLGSAGIYGVMSHAVSRRTHEIGVRVALGAGRGDILTMIVGRGLLLVSAGEAAGLAAALALHRVIAGMLFHVGPADPATYAAVSVLWIVVGLAACYIPARRSLRVDPTTALRCE